MCFSGGDKGPPANRRRDRRDPHSSRQPHLYHHSQEIELAPRPYEGRHGTSHRAPISHYPAQQPPTGASFVQAVAGPSHSTTNSSPSISTSGGYESSMMSAESCKTLADGLEMFSREIQHIEERIRYLTALRKRLSHRAKKIDEAEYEQILNTPSMIALHDEYKDMEDHAKACKHAADARREQIRGNYNYATEEEHLEICDLQEKWVRAMLNTAAKRLEYLQDHPYAYANKKAVHDHIGAAKDCMKSARKALKEINENRQYLYTKLNRHGPRDVY